jgi:hypothetical protein
MRTKTIIMVMAVAAVSCIEPGGFSCIEPGDFS